MWTISADPPTTSPLSDTPTLTLAAESGTLGSIEEWINNVFDPLSEGLSTFVFAEISVFGISFPWIVGWLIAAAAIFSVYFGFIQFRGFKMALELVRGRYSKKDDPGEITHFQALSSAVSGTVGLGNIAGVGVAVTIGGAGATFWMILAGLLGMCTKFVECTLGVRYRETHEDGTVSGGPMYYLRKGIAERFGERGGKAVGRVLAVLASVMILFFAIAGGNMFQANQTFAQLRDVTGGSEGFLGTDGAALIFGILLAAVVGAVIIGGIKSIGKVTSKLVPSMAILYILACLVVIGTNITAVPSAFGAIISGAFSPEGVLGGAIGALIVGFQRAAFSNEAGLGSAPIAHSAVKTRHPVTEGYVALLEPFIDTVVICTMTALTIIIAKTEFWTNAQASVFAGGEVPNGVTVTSESFATVLPWFPYVLTLAVALFALSTLITWAYYGQKAWTYLFGKSPVTERVYQVVFCLFIVAGSVLTLGSVLNFADAVLFLLALFNIIGLYLLAPVVKRELRSFQAKIRSGEVKKNDRVGS
ncbi:MULTISPECIES: alanine/glycine:cation symporter family protein [Actinokineospora]|uniref:Alanine glycine permease n=1 Tax=Actinokineospora fastidiosa TaxID=1816 RepID=A0A918LHV2_9PSEU|nr:MULTISPECIES: alanine/glycine:cation symporter family protein [Actinokineospora]UVS78213.1 Amino-acid carrier protein AlsT [Actinokineospora sp. UTMC 2448]GGS48849.1 alanine glycine permease [Actinokineospora fastidiosa]